jgi:mannitol-1-phosphate/altronate dehydrogenase
MPATFVGFGFGPIQTGLMLHEAMESGNFGRFVVAEVDQGLVDAVRAAGNVVSINIAGRTGIRTRRLSRVELFNPRVDTDRRAIVSAIGDATELATAIPSVSLYAAGGEASVAALLADGASPDRQRIVYTSENNNFAAELLQEELLKRAPSEKLSSLQLLNTVIGKMSGVISSAEEMRRLDLAPLVPGFEKCVLVEEFNRILISRITLAGFVRGIRVFEEKDDLLPFEEAKLFGHNAIHALLGYMAQLRGYEVMSRVREDAELMSLGRKAFLEESGAALIRKHGPTGDPLFTPAGYTAYADDLLDRMTNPFLHDRVDRIIRDPRRKLAWNDRLFGTMRVALKAGIEPTGMATGAAAATRFALRSEQGADADPKRYLSALWGEEAAGPEREKCLSLVTAALAGLNRWEK